MKLISCITFLLLFTGLTESTAQTAPDFTVTDSWGNTHTLYEDYLDQGKTVVIKIFYVACPPCNSIAPHLEPLYQDWGGGQGDVQFIELSMQQGDSDAEVNAYKNTHGTTFPAAGAQGNSVAATVPYTNGTFGLWGGTPTFIVIAPNGTLVYDVYGFGIPGTITAIDAAIAATGAEGLPTGIHGEKKRNPVTLLSNLVSSELILNVEEEIAGIHVDIISPLGENVIVNKFSTIKGVQVSIDLSGLPAGLWICRMMNEEQHFVASYLFVKN